MISFEKIHTEIVRNLLSFFMIRDLKPSIGISNFSDKEIIDSLIKSKYHYWRGEEVNDVLVGSTYANKKGNIDNVSKHKFYGFFDSEKISAGDYKQISFENLKLKLRSHVDQWCNDSGALSSKIISFLEKTIKVDSVFYFLDLDLQKNSDKVAAWHVYSTFLGFVNIDKKNKVISIMEFGED